MKERPAVRLGMIGYGAIGKHVEAALKAGGIENLELVAALVKRPRSGSLLTHEPEKFFTHRFDAVAECAVVPSPDPVRGAVPKAYVVLRAGVDPSPEVARSVFAHCREHLNGYQLVRIVEFTEELPKTVSSKIRRVELRADEAERVATGNTQGQYFYRDFR